MERKRISFTAKIEPIEKLNDSFLKCKVYVCALGKNANLSFISKEAADDAEYGLPYLPVIGHLYEDEDGNRYMGSHDMVVEKDENGNYKYKSICVPYGTVMDNVHYETVTEKNGKKKEYVVADSVLWIGRFPELLDAAYSEDWLFNQSMEIDVFDYAPLEEDENYYNIKKYAYSALCLLGRYDDEHNVEPCFPSAHIEAYDLNENSEFKSLMEQLKKDLSECFSSNHDGKEGEMNMTDEIRDAILAEYNVTLKELDFEINEETTEESFRSQVEAFVQSRDQEPEGAPEGEPEGEDPASEDPAPEEEPEEQGESTPVEFTYMDMYRAIDEAVSKKFDGWATDFDETYAYITVWDSGDSHCKHGRCAYTYDKLKNEAVVADSYEEMFLKWLTADEVKSLEEKEAAFEELKAYKEAREKADKENEFDSAIEEFADLAGNEEYDAVYNNRYSYESVDALKNACYIIRGKFGLINQPKKTNNGMSVPVGTPRETMTAREKLHEEYGKR